jgi:hypothetical protein
MFAECARFDNCISWLLVHVFMIVYVLLFVHVLLISLFMSHVLIILFIYSNTFIFTYRYFCLIYVCVLLANTSRKSHLILGPNRSRVSGESPTCLPLVYISIPFPVWVFRDLRVQFYNVHLIRSLNRQSNTCTHLVFYLLKLIWNFLKHSYMFQSFDHHQGVFSSLLKSLN